MWTLLRCTLLFALIAGSTIGSVADAAPPADRLLPDTTMGFLSVGNLERLEDRWRQSQFGRFVEDEAMRPFIDEVRSRIERRTSAIRDKVGLSLSDLEGIASGEVAVAVVRPNDQAAALALLADVTGREAKARELLDKVDANLTARGAGKQADILRTTRLTIYTMPPEEGRGRAQTIVVFLRGQMLCVADDREVAEGILARFADNAQSRLTDVPAYRESMQRCQAAAGDLAPDIRWFIEPFGFTYAVRAMQPQRQRPARRRDVAEILQRQGFDAIKGIGGYVNLHSDRGIELLHRTAVYAPADGEASSDVALRLLQFPTGGDLLPPAWVPHDVATFISLNWDIQSAFDHVGPLFDDFHRSNTFDKILEGIAKDPYGPQVDIRRELIAYLGHRISVITDYELPITTKSERFVIAVESTNDPQLADAIRRLMEPDKRMHRREFQGHVLWETVEEPAAGLVVPKIEDEDEAFHIAPLEERNTEAAKPRPPQFPNSAIGVVNGRLWIASHIDYLKQVLTGVPPSKQLAEAVDFARVKTTIGALAPESLTLRGFSRTDQEYRPTFELLRKGMMPKSETLLGRVLNEFLAEDDDEPRKQKVDASKLPPFDEVEQYFGPAGLIISPEKDGWFIVGAMLSADGTELASLPE